MRDGEATAGTTMALTLAIDHRVLDGATGGRFLADLKALLEQPLRIVASTAAVRPGRTGPSPRPRSSDPDGLVTDSGRQGDGHGTYRDYHVTIW